MNKHTTEKECYFWASLCLTLVSNALVFQGSRLFTQNSHHYTLSLPVDAAIPFLPWTISIYFGCFLFWFVMYRLISQLPRERANRFFCANHLGKVICLVAFLIFPTTIRRPDVNGTTAWDTFMRFLYWIDAPDNLFPSLHCMIAWLCWVGIRGNRQVSILWRIVALVMAVAVCLSTLTTRQHVLLDVAGGILLSELCYWGMGSEKLLHTYSVFVDKLLIGTKQIKEKLMI